MDNNIIKTEDLTVYYGKHRGIKNVNLSVNKGEVFGFLGPNGAGKTTTERVLLDVFRPTKGSATIFGMDCQKQGVEIRKQVGYLPGELSLYPGMKGHDFLELIASLLDKKVDQAYLRELYERLELDPSRKMREYSRGNKQKIGIASAFMSKPDLLILDEPTGGLDPLMQQTVLELVREAKHDGRTVFFSSHILPEVQEICDRVGIIRDGQLIKTERVEVLTHQQFKRLHITFQQMPATDTFAIDGVTETERVEQTVTLEVRHSLDKVMEIAVPYGITDIETPPVSLEEVFLAFYERNNHGGNHV